MNDLGKDFGKAVLKILALLAFLLAILFLLIQCAKADPVIVSVDIDRNSTPTIIGAIATPFPTNETWVWVSSTNVNGAFFTNRLGDGVYTSGPMIGFRFTSTASTNDATFIRVMRIQ